MKATIQFAERRFDDKGYLKSVNRVAKQLAIDAIKEFLITAAAKIPVLTGMAQGTLRPLAEFVGQNLPTITPKGKAGYRRGRGEAEGRAAQQNTFTFENGLYEFTFMDNVRHFDINDTVNMHYKFSPNQTPWRALRSGKEAAMAFLKRNAPIRIPPPRKFFMKGSVVKTYGG